MALGACVGVVAGVLVDAADAARMIERPVVAERRAAVDVPPRLLQRAAEGEVVPLVGGRGAAVGGGAVAERAGRLE